MPSTGWILPTQSRVFGPTSDVGWSAWQNLLVDDTSACTSNHDDRISRTLNGYDFPFPIPEGAEITGIEMRFNRRVWHTATYGSPDARDHTVSLVQGQNLVGENKADTVTKYPEDEQYYIIDYGGSNDLWGLSLTREDVLDEEFGFGYRVTGGKNSSTQVRNIWLQVHYTVPSSGSSMFMLFSVKERLKEIFKPKPLWEPALILP